MTDQTETDTQFVRRIMAMLLSLAGIAERAAKRSYPVRAFLLWILRPAETAAQDYVGVEDLWAGTNHGNGPDDALDLAASFRELASFLREDLEHEAAEDRIVQGWWTARNAEAAGGSGVLAKAVEAESLISCAIRSVMVAIDRFGSTRRAKLAGLAPRRDSS